MDARKELLLMSAARLYSLGVEVEAAREQVRRLAEQGTPYSAKAMREACRDFFWTGDTVERA